MKRKVKSSIGPHSSLKKNLFSIAIALLTVFFIGYATNTVYPSPQWQDFCDDRQPGKLANTQTTCEEHGGVWIEFEMNVENEGPEGWCDYYTTCQKEYETAREPYERNVFITNIILGIALLIGAYSLSVEAVSGGLMGGGILTLIYGSIRYWGELPDLLRTVILGIALFVLIFSGYKKLK